MKKTITAILLAAVAFAEANAAVPYKFNVPEIPGYVILTGDFHVHTVFSDCNTWPTTRVSEAYQDDLDMLSITDHLDSRHRKMVQKGYFTEICDQNTSYKLASDVSKKYGVRVLHGAELTRGTRLFPGHFNTHFISDATLITKAAEAQDAEIGDVIKREETAIINGLKAAREQGAFITFNHPNWAPQQPVKTEWLPIHEQVFQAGMMDGIEIVNHSVGFCPDGFHWAIERGLTVVSGTDCHCEMFELVDYAAGEMRSRTLIFAKENTEESIKEALFAGRTLVYFDGNFYGPEAWMRPFFEGALQVISKKATKSGISIKVKNTTSVPIYLAKAEGSENLSMPFNRKVSPGEELTLSASPLNGGKEFNFKECDFNFKVLNYFVDTDKPLEVSWHFVIK